MLPGTNPEGTRGILYAYTAKEKADGEVALGAVKIFEVSPVNYSLEEFKQLVEYAMAYFEGREPRDVIKEMNKPKAKLYGPTGKRIV